MIGEADPERIRLELSEVGRAASAPATIVLIGGCNMAIRGWKSSTKDVDLVVRETPEPELVLSAFESTGFRVVDGYYLPGAPLDPHTMLENDTGTWIDLFLPARLFGDLDYSIEMSARESAWFRSGLLSYVLADASAVFLLKSVTGRWRADSTRDIPDLVSLLDAGVVEWSFVQDEWGRQLARHPDPERLRKLAREAMTALRPHGYRRLPWKL